MKLWDENSQPILPEAYFFKRTAGKFDEGKPVGVAAKGLVLYSREKLVYRKLDQVDEVKLMDESMLERWLWIASFVIALTFVITFIVSSAEFGTAVFFAVFSLVLVLSESPKIYRLFSSRLGKYLEFSVDGNGHEFYICAKQWNEFGHQVLEMIQPIRPFVQDTKIGRRFPVLGELRKFARRVWRYFNEV